MDLANAQAPPPYTPRQPLEASNPEELLTEIANHVALEHSAPGSYSPSLAREVERIQNFMIYVVSMDYQCNTSAALAAHDREHFIIMHNTLQDLAESHGKIGPSLSQRQILAAYFWTHLREPCRVLRLPVECVLNACSNFMNFSNFRGRYRDSCFGTLQTLGVADLARKLQVDRKHIIRRVIDDLALRQKYFRAIDEIEQIYFKKINGVEASNITASNRRGWSMLRNISFELNDRGRMYEAQRQSAIGDMINCATLSIYHWRARVITCVSDLLCRCGELQAGENRWIFWDRSVVWIRETSFYLPDFFDNYSEPACTDA